MLNRFRRFIGWRGDPHLPVVSIDGVPTQLQAVPLNAFIYTAKDRITKEVLYSGVVYVPGGQDQLAEQGAALVHQFRCIDGLRPSKPAIEADSKP